MPAYDRLPHSLADRPEDDRGFATNALYILEWKYNVELFYACAVEAEKHKQKDVIVQDVALLCSDCHMPRAYDMTQTLHTHSRFIKKRMDLVPLLYDGTDLEELALKFMCYHNLRYEVKYTLTVNEVPFITLFKKLTTPADWAEYLRQNYDITTIYTKKEWTPAFGMCVSCTM